MFKKVIVMKREKPALQLPDLFVALSPAFLLQLLHLPLKVHLQWQDVSCDSYLKPFMNHKHFCIMNTNTTRQRSIGDGCYLFKC